MLRLTEIRLPIDHTEDDVTQAIAERLAVAASELVCFTTFRRGVDARKKNAIQFVYTIDVTTTIDSVILQRLSDHPHVKRAPDMRYRFVAQASGKDVPRPVVVGFGPCGMFAALVLAQARPGIERTVRRRRRRHLFRREAVYADQGSDALRTQGAHRIRESGRARRNPVRQQAAHRHFPAGKNGRADARRNRIAWRRIPLPEPG